VFDIGSWPASSAQYLEGSSSNQPLWLAACLWLACLLRALSRRRHACPLRAPPRQAYSAANDRFGEVVLAHYQGGDMVWVQDYHLMLLPQLLKQGHPKMKARGGRRARAPRRALAPGRVGARRERG
jgi:hypothetical protein